MSITIGSFTITNPSEENIEYEVIGASYIMASGIVQHDNINSVSIQLITLSWKAVSKTVRDSIIDAYESLFTSDRTYVDIRGDTYTVTASQGRDKLTSVAVNRSTPLYNLTLKMREVI